MLGRMARLAMILGLLAGLAACSGVRERVFGVDARDFGLPFRADLDTGETRREFTVTVRAEGVSLDDARESARYPATRHCIERFGRSDVNWTIDPATGDWAVTRTEDGRLRVFGQCDAR